MVLDVAPFPAFSQLKLSKLTKIQVFQIKSFAQSMTRIKQPGMFLFLNDKSLQRGQKIILNKNKFSYSFGFFDHSRFSIIPGKYLKSVM